jgi:hypothetical protein
VGQITDKAADTYRDFTTASLPASGPNEPRKEDIRALFNQIDGSFSQLAAAFVADAATLIYANRDSLYANLSPADRSIGIVYNDTPERNGVYIKDGAAGSGAWVATGLMLRGAQGNDGRQGDAGAAGQAGESFYQIAIRTGAVPATTSERAFISNITQAIVDAATLRVQAQSDSASYAASRAGDYAKAAELAALTAPGVFATIAAGVAGTASGNTFWAQAGGAIALYRKVGASAVLIVSLETAGSDTLTAYGAVADARMARRISTTAGNATITSQAAIFADSDVGKAIIIGFGPGSPKQRTTIAAVVSPTQITLAAPAAATVANGGISWGTDCSAALQAGFAAMRAAGGGKMLIDGIFLLTSPVSQSFAATFTEARISIAGTGTDSAIIIGTDSADDAITLANVSVDMADFGIIGAVDATADGRRILMLSNCTTVLRRMLLQGLLASEAVVLNTGGSLHQEHCNYGGTFVPGNDGYTQAVTDNTNWYAFRDHESSYIDYGYWRGLELSKTGQSGTLAWIRAQNPIGTLGARQEGVFELDGTRMDENTLNGVVVRSTGARIQTVRLAGVRANIINATSARGMHIENVRDVEVVDCAHGLAATDIPLGSFVNCTTVLIEGQRLSAKVNGIIAVDVPSLTIKDSDPFLTYDFTRVGYRPVTSALGPYAIVKVGAVSDADFPTPPAAFTRGYDRSTGREYVKSAAGGWTYYAIAGGDLIGNELIVNGTFDSGTTGWTPVNSGQLSVVGGKLRVTNGAAYGYAYQRIAVTPGQTYRASWQVTNGTAPAVVYIGSGQEQRDLVPIGAASPATFTATGTEVYVHLALDSPNAGAYADFDNVSLRAI